MWYWLIAKNQVNKTESPETHLNTYRNLVDDIGGIQ
jgi:hypothetical protein